MLDYSLGLRLVNPGDAESDKKVFAYPQMRQLLTMKRFARHISSHGSPYSRDVILGVLTAAVDCLREMLLEGYKVQLGDMGSFYVTFNGKGVDDATEYNPAIHIKKVNVRWERSEEFTDLKKDAEFNLVDTREKQAAQRKALKAALNDEMGVTTDSGDDSGAGSGSGGGDGDDSGVTE